MSRLTPTCDCHYFADCWYDLTKHGQLKNTEIMASLGISNSLVASYKSYYVGVIVVCDTTFSELTQLDKVQVALRYHRYVVEFHCYTVQE